ncbi:Hypothetical_protein [Hexamita inflata]|uniref:Hypothetical_protein n=1 Tax=Hexamita inflata TaxID=28002 RepID=A0AA86RJD7_9EUKA|nr:Hypothetical protein HINF_LOCUS60922 [Hexamita inflata]
MNYSLTQEGQKYDFDRIDHNRLFKVVFNIPKEKQKYHMQQKDGNDKINAVEDVQGRSTNSLNKLGSSEAFYSLHFWVQRMNSKILYQSELVISLVQDVPVQFLRFSQQNQFMKDLSRKYMVVSLIGEKNKRIQ